MRALTAEEKVQIREAKDAVNRLKTAKRQELTTRIKSLPHYTALRKELEAECELLTPITGNPVYVRANHHHGRSLIIVNYDTVKKALWSLRKFMMQRIWMTYEGEENLYSTGKCLLLEYRDGRVEGRIEFYEWPKHDRPVGPLPVIEL